MDWKRTLTITGLLLCAIGARADIIGDEDDGGFSEQAPAGASEVFGPPAPIFESPMNFNECQLGGRRFGCHPHPKKSSWAGKGKNRRRVSRIRFHTGWDMQARPKGTPNLRSIGKGEVVSAGRMKGPCGIAVKIKLENGYFATYCHMSAVTKGMKPGDKITPGQVIGKMGSSGACEGPHLHFVVSTCENTQECAIDPARVLDPAKMCKENVPDQTRGREC